MENKNIKFEDKIVNRKSSKPPLGLIPKFIYEKQTISARIKDIQEAIDRYIAAEYDIPYQWIVEYNSYVKKDTL